MPSIFSQYIVDTLEREPKVSSQVELKHQPAGRLLNWILNFWDGDTISVRDICNGGPRPRKWKEASSLVETLARQGWLVPIGTHRHDRKEWKIIREIKK